MVRNSAARTKGAMAPAQTKKRGGAKRVSDPSPDLGSAADIRWTFLSNHSHVLILLDRDPSTVLRDVALKVGITERAVQRIIADLEANGFIEREKIGRQNHYKIKRNRPLRHPIESHRSIGELLALANG